ncbi:hypothetical protein CLHOM_20570 [Clostridium homopropionicum DSM 5847]|uniref:Uncharacterized protein n=1 Tax=Clostridium homopropionicum DSM 5847 TaxID=1121318 RepID=A0A0L6Z904_9CLOT|nr:hypothetical protein [Clostridium homopropionicum]KOA19449.1 hypothetical protein CLHOM_20570 [Clostridium homopropionicum DSM 5847]SFH01581.1 hypothetical protein SAMN04488501_1373 [Clostridium homopropionicum]
MNKIISKAFVGIILILLLILNLVIMLRFNNVTEDIGRNYEELNHLKRDIDNLSKDLNKLSEKQDWVNNKEYKIIEISDDYKTVKIMIQGSLKELDNNSDVYLLYGKAADDSTDDIKWIKTHLSISYGLGFSKKLDLPYQENYKFKILEEGSNRLRSEELFYISFKEDVENRMTTHVFSNSKTKDFITLNLNINNDYKGLEKLKVKNIKINIYNGKDIAKTVLIYSNGKLVEDNNELNINTSTAYSDSDKNKYFNIERLNYNIKIKDDIKNDTNLKFETEIEDYMGKKFNYKVNDD